MNFFQYLRPSNLSQKIVQKGILVVQREIILQTLLNILLVIYTVGFAAIILFAQGVIRSGQVGIYLLVYLAVAAITIIRQIPYFVRALLVIVALQALGAAALLAYGLSGTGLIFIIASILLTVLLFSGRISLLFLFVSLAIIALIGGSMITGRIPLPPAQAMANSGYPAQWVTAVMVLLFAVGLTGSSMNVILRGMNNALLQAEKLTQAVQAEQSSLEQRVEERASELRKRVNQFEIASQIAREISGETNLENLLGSSVNLIRDRFGFYHAGIFLTDERGEYAVLRAATGEAGRIMLERNHRLKIGEIGLVGFAVSRGEARISLNVSGDVIHYKNPLLPDTRAEMAIPLRTGSGTIGALDVQSVVEDAFTQEDVQILQTIADQLAVAFEKTRLVDELRKSLEELEGSTRSTTQKAWRTHLRNTRQRLAYRYRDSQLDSYVEETQHAQEAIAKGQMILQTNGVDGQGRAFTVLAVPIRLRNQVLGVVDIHFDSASVSPDLIALIEGTVNRLAVSLENARLLEEIQFRAERERLVGEISSKVRTASDVDSVLRIAIQQIGESLGVSEVMVQLKKDT